MKCDNCGAEATYIRRSARAYGEGENLVVIENVPVISCRNCGMDSLDASTVHELNRLRSHPDVLAPLRRVHVATFHDQAVVSELEEVAA